MAIVLKDKPRRPAKNTGRTTENDIAIKSCSWFPATESAVWVEVGSAGFFARGRIVGKEEVKLATSPTRHYSVALARAEAWAAAYKVPVVYVIAASSSD